MNNNTTFETSKTVKYSISSIIKKMENYTIRFDHPAQRLDDQWTNRMKGNLISDILQGNPIPALVLAEQIIGGMSIIWNLDGKQRCTNVYKYVKDEYKIPSSVRRNIIRYQEIVRDENKMPVLENGIPVYEWKEFNIANKKFSQLPEVLQDRILEYCFDATLYLNCSSEDIIYHIDRYNDGKPMNKSQKEIISLGEDFAGKVKELSNSHFFTEHGTFKGTDKTKGTIDRIITKSIMAINFLDDWRKDKLCKYLEENAHIDMFDDLGEILDELTDIVTDEHKTLFNTKDTFIWFTVYAKFRNSGIQKERFGEFLSEFVNVLKEEKVNDKTFEDLDRDRNTEDKSLVLEKINYIENLLNEYFKAAA